MKTHSTIRTLTRAFGRNRANASPANRPAIAFAGGKLVRLFVALLPLWLPASSRAHWPTCVIWESKSASGPVRMSHAMAYAGSGNLTLLFGGWNGVELKGDSWVWDGSTWMQLSPPTQNPSPRKNHAMVYDWQRDVTLLFGGTNGGALDDTWVWDGPVWTDVSPITASPSGRAYHAMAQDSTRGVIVLFGGFDTVDTYFGDTWEWNGTDWTLVANDGPSPRARHAMAYDQRRNITVLFGGGDSTGNLSDTWEWDGNTWTLKATDGPTATLSSYMADLGAWGRLLLVTDAGKTWGWSGDEWILERDRGTTPTRIEGAVASHPFSSDNVVLHGGEGSPGSLTATWEMKASCWIPTVSGWGLMVMSLLVLTAGTILVRRRPAIV